jgi:hypothetical protein
MEEASAKTQMAKIRGFEKQKKGTCILCFTTEPV